MKKMTLILLALLLTLLWGCGSKQEASETINAAAETSAGSTFETEAVPDTAEEAASAVSSEEAAPEEETVPEEWISYEETPETPTRPMEVAQEQSVSEVIVPDVNEELPEYQPEPNENETPLAIG